jgi:hypothetical protein
MALFPKKTRIAAALLLPVLAALVPGCSLGFTNLHPGENSALYQHLFDDIINNYDEPYWLWVRGTIAGDLDGDGVVSEEVAVATIQKGTAKNPGPVEMAFIVACHVGKDGKRVALARQLLFDASPVPAAPKPANDLNIVADRPFTHCRAQMVQDKVTLKETVVVYFWSDPLPSTVWYAGYGLDDGKWVKNLETALWQDTPGFLSTNLDRSIEASPYGYQMVFGVSAIPGDVMRKVIDPQETPRNAPLWGHVFARNAQGRYEQADERFGQHYTQIVGPWNQIYLKASLKNLPPGDMAWFEYHMAIMNRYTGDREMAAAFLKKAAAGAKDPILVRGIRNAGAELFSTTEDRNR